MVGILSDVGKVRKLNEDFADFYKGKNLNLYVIADGMGGHNAGEVASRIAVETTISNIKARETVDMKKDLLEAINLANEKIYKLSRSNDEFVGMGTTITACLVRDMKMVVANVGDS
jgi:protein phosphatase